MPHPHTKHYARVPYADIEPYISRLMEVDNQTGVGKALGYSGANSISDWRRAGECPTTALLAAKHLCADLGDQAAAAQSAPTPCLLVVAGPEGPALAAVRTLVGAFPSLSLLEVNL